MIIGAHLSISRGLAAAARTAASIGLDAIQVFSRSPRGGRARVWPDDEVRKLKLAITEAGLRPLVVHVPYFVNLASDRHDVREYGRQVLAEDLARADRIDAEFVVLHPGSSGGNGTDEGYRHLLDGLETVLGSGNYRAKLLVENMAGRGTELGGDLLQLVTQIGRLSGYRVGLCFDTCHAFAAGYDISKPEVVADVWALAGTGSNGIALVHVNDSRFDLGSRKDRHASIGDGVIGLEGFAPVCERCCSSGVAMILETPVTRPAEFAIDAARLRELGRVT